MIVLIHSSIVFAQTYSASLKYGNMDWIPRNNKTLNYEHLSFFHQFYFPKIGLSLWQGSCFTKSPNSYEIAGIDHSFRKGKFISRVGFHGLFTKDDILSYNQHGKLIPNVGLTYLLNDYALSLSFHQLWNYQFTEQVSVLNFVGKRLFSWGELEFGQYINCSSFTLSGMISYTKSWQLYKKLKGFSTIRGIWNESKPKQNENHSIIVNIGIKF